jgi:hypothetical protein
VSYPLGKKFCELKIAFIYYKLKVNTSPFKTTMQGIFQYQNGKILTSPHCGLKLNCVICTAVNFIARTYQLNTLYVHNFIEIHSWKYSTVQIWSFYSKLMTKLPWSKILISVNAKYTCNWKCVYPSRSTNLKKFIPHLCKNFKSSPYMCDCPDYRGPGSESQRSTRILIKIKNYK